MTSDLRDQLKMLEIIGNDNETSSLLMNQANYEKFVEYADLYPELEMVNEDSEYESQHIPLSSYKVLETGEEFMDDEIAVFGYLVSRNKALFFTKILQFIIFTSFSLLLYSIIVRIYLDKFTHHSWSDQIYINIQRSTAEYPQPKSLSYLPWNAIVEPFHRYTATLMTIEYARNVYNFNKSLINDKISFNSSDYEVVWIFNNNDYYYGIQIEFQLNSTGVIPLVISIINKNTLESVITVDAFAYYSQSFTVAVKYIRRELRSMSENDRLTFFSALQEMYSTSQEEGEIKYGNKYRSIESLVYKHLSAAASSDCDHWHDGAGILTNHAAYTLEAVRSH